MNFLRVAGGGNYIKEVYKEYLVALDDDEFLDKFNIQYSDYEKIHIRNLKQVEEEELKVI